MAWSNNRSIMRTMWRSWILEKEEWVWLKVIDNRSKRPNDFVIFFAKMICFQKENDKNPHKLILTDRLWSKRGIKKFLNDLNDNLKLFSFWGHPSFRLYGQQISWESSNWAEINTCNDMSRKWAVQISSIYAVIQKTTASELRDDLFV